MLTTCDFFGPLPRLLEVYSFDETTEPAKRFSNEVRGTFRLSGWVVFVRFLIFDRNDFTGLNTAGTLFPTTRSPFWCSCAVCGSSPRFFKMQIPQNVFSLVKHRRSHRFVYTFNWCCVMYSSRSRSPEWAPGTSAAQIASTLSCQRTRVALSHSITMRRYASYALFSRDARFAIYWPTCIVCYPLGRRREEREDTVLPRVA